MVAVIMVTNIIYFQQNAPLYDPVKNRKLYVADLELFTREGKTYWLWDSGLHEIAHPIRDDYTLPLNDHPHKAVAQDALQRQHVERFVLDALVVKQSRAPKIPVEKSAETITLGKNKTLVDAICSRLGV